MNRFSMLVIALCALSFQAQAFEDKDQTYFCSLEASGGIAFDVPSHRWVGTLFKIDDEFGKFVLKLKFLNRSRIDKGKYFDTKISEYNVSYAQIGKEGLPCEYDRIYAHGDAKLVVPVIDDRTLRCSSGLHDITLDLETKRFLSVYAQGYTGGKDNNDDTPAISGGRCTRID